MSCASFIRGLEKEKHRAIVKFNTMLAKQHTVEIEEESMQAKKEDTTQLIYRDKHNCKRVGQDNWKRVGQVVVESIDLVILVVFNQSD